MNIVFSILVGIAAWEVVTFALFLSETETKISSKIITTIGAILITLVVAGLTGCAFCHIFNWTFCMLK